MKLVTLNVKGLGSVLKRRIEMLIKRNKLDIVFLQETYQSKEGLYELKISNFDIYEKSFGSSKARGVATLISKHCECVINKVVKDGNGRYIILQVTMGLEDLLYFMHPMLNKIYSIRMYGTR